MADAPARDRRGLGRGLSALLGDGDPTAVALPGSALVELSLDAISPNPDQPRASIDPAALEALAASLRATGVLQPVVVAPADASGHHELIAGERRWRAARLAGMERIPAVVRAVDARERLELALVENVVREDLSPIDVAQACACLIEDFGQTHGELAGRLGRSRPAISNLVRLLELPEGVQEMIAAGVLTEGHGRAILMADGPARRTRVAERAIAEGLSVRATEDLAREPERGGPGGARATAEPTPLGDAALEAFGSALRRAGPGAHRAPRPGDGRAPLRRRGRPAGRARPPLRLGLPGQHQAQGGPPPLGGGDREPPAGQGGAFLDGGDAEVALGHPRTWQVGVEAPAVVDDLDVDVPPPHARAVMVDGSRPRG